MLTQTLAERDGQQFLYSLQSLFTKTTTQCPWHVISQKRVQSRKQCSMLVPWPCLRNMVGELVSKELLDLVEIEPSLDSLPPFDSASLGFLVVQAGFCALLLQLRG